MSTTGQTVYEQLQEFLNECVKLGYISDFIHKCFVSCDIDGVHFISRDESIHKSIHMGYHDLFSVDSGIMEFVEWKKDDNIESITINEHGGFKYDVKRSPYYNMSDMTSEEKCIYFLSNAKLPTK